MHPFLSHRRRSGLAYSRIVITRPRTMATLLLRASSHRYPRRRSKVRRSGERSLLLPVAGLQSHQQRLTMTRLPLATFRRSQPRNRQCGEWPQLNASFPQRRDRFPRPHALLLSLLSRRTRMRPRRRGQSQPRWGSLWPLASPRLLRLRRLYPLKVCRASLRRLQLRLQAPASGVTCCPLAKTAVRRTTPTTTAAWCLQLEAVRRRCDCGEISTVCIPHCCYTMYTRMHRISYRGRDMMRGDS